MERDGFHHSLRDTGFLQLEKGVHGCIAGAAAFLQHPEDGFITEFAGGELAHILHGQGELGGALIDPGQLSPVPLDDIENTPASEHSRGGAAQLGGRRWTTVLTSGCSTSQMGEQMGEQSGCQKESPHTGHRPSRFPPTPDRGPGHWRLRSLEAPVAEEDRLTRPQLQGGEKVLLHDPSSRI